MSAFAEKIAREHDLMTRGTDEPKENAVAAIDEVICLLRHAIQRNHPHDPRGCSVCEAIEEAI